MTSPVIRSLAVAVAACLGLFGCSERNRTPASGRSGSPDGGPANVLLIVIDTLRADRLGIYAYSEPTSPNLDALSARGVRLEQYRTAVPTTLASFTTLLTGRHPHTHGVYRNGVPWPEGLTGLPTLFGERGYRTAGFVASYCLTSPSGLGRGFEHFDEELTIAMDDLPQNRLIRRGESVTESVLAWLDDSADDPRPFFALVHYFDPHWPYSPPPPYDRMFDPEYVGEVSGSMADLRAARRRLAARGGEPDAGSRHLHALHLGEIRYTDDRIGELLRGLTERGLDDRTLVVVTADHGESFHEHGNYFDHGLTVYDTNIRVPLIAAGPGVSSDGHAVPAEFSSVDLAPTLAEYAGLPLDPGYEGRSFLPWLADPDARPPEPRDLFAEATKPHLAESGDGWPNRRKARCILRQGRKLIRTPWRRGRLELYEPLADPGEIRDLLLTTPGPWAGLDAMALALQRWSEAAPESVAEPPERRPEVRERLRSLGYLD